MSSASGSSLWRSGSTATIDMEIIVYAAVCEPGDEHRAAWRLLEVALQRELGLAMPRVERAEKGKPYFPDMPHICFNLSHSRGAAVCAVHDSPLGIDMEKLRGAPRRLARGLSDEAFFRRWTGREASVKLRGEPWQALLKDSAPDGRCLWLDELLPGWIVALCPEKESPIRCVRMGTDELYQS